MKMNLTDIPFSLLVSLFGSYLNGLKYFALNKFSGMECQ
jgi:hypothetical protein